jgi:hypothetical protein
MALEIRTSSKWWNGSWVINGRKTGINLGVPITGKRAPKRTMLGDDEFERSRGRAKEAHDRQERQLTINRNAESALRKLVEIKTGRQAGFPKMAELPKLWLEITLALAAGVPLELVQRVTGHRTVEVVMKHYFRPGREDFRTAILKAMPKMLADSRGRKSIKEEILALLDKTSA